MSWEGVCWGIDPGWPMKAAVLVLFTAGWGLGPTLAPPRLPAVAQPLRVEAATTKPLPWWNSAERERVRSLGAPVFFDLGTFPGRPDLGNPQAPQFPKPLW